MRKRQGFTLLELMAVVAIIAILAAIAMTQYSGYLVKSRRQDGRSKILEVAQREERYFTENGSYCCSTVSGINVATGLGYSSTTITSDEGYYSVTVTVSQSIPAGPYDQYSITAAPVGPQTSDTYCSRLSYTNTNLRGASGTGGSACW